MADVIASKEQANQTLEELKLWIVATVDGDVKCGEIRKRLEKIQSVQDFIKRLVYGS